MSGLFSPNFIGGLGVMLRETIEHGATVYPGALRLEVCSHLSEEAAVGEFIKLEPKPGSPVVEDMEMQKVPIGHPRFSMLTRVGMELAGLINPLLSLHKRPEWLPNQAAVHRYHAGSGALSAHKDYSSDVLLIAVFTLSGRGGFDLLHDDGTLGAGWECGPGDLCLMRAPGLTDAEDDRPLHRALPPQSGTRESLIYRQINWELAAARNHL